MRTIMPRFCARVFQGLVVRKLPVLSGTPHLHNEILPESGRKKNTSPETLIPERVGKKRKNIGRESDHVACAPCVRALLLLPHLLGDSCRNR